jgi:hypothetical protein
LPYPRRPRSLGGKGSDPVWYIEPDELAPSLQFIPDNPTHGTIEVSRPMSLQEFQDAVAATRPKWRMYVDQALSFRGGAMISIDRLHQPLQSDPRGEELRRIILVLAREGHTKDEIYGAMNELLDQIREKHGGESAEEDTILELMDALVGWCHPNARLL